MHYRLVVYRYYNSQQVKERFEFIPLDFLPSLLKKDMPLHNLIIDTIALVSRENLIPLWDEDGDYSEKLKKTLDLPLKDNSVAKGQISSYANGVASKYLSLVKERREVITRDDIIKQVNDYDNNSQRKNLIIWWVKKGIRLSKTRQNITENTFIPSYTNCKAITPYRSYKFIWSNHKNDIINKVVKKSMLDEYKSNGMILPLEFSIALPGEVRMPIEYDDFPVELYDFMSTGVSIFLWRYKDYFYKKQMEKNLTPSEILLQNIELSEIENL